MDPFVTHNGISIMLGVDEQPFELKGRGWVHPAKVVGSATRDQLAGLLGLTLWSDTVIGVESFAVYDQTNAPIGLLLAKKVWG